MPTYKELVQQREALERQIADARQRETADAVARVRAIVAEFGLTTLDVFGGGKGRPAAKAKTAGSKVAPKYRDPATGATWTGRGKMPKWIEGQDRARFAIK
jgi:DNA-binding protein H-NS